MIESVLLLDKPLGISPLDAIKHFQIKNPRYEKMKLGVAGRLDPMAEGLLLVLVGNENKKRKEYERLNKEYIFTVLFGITTDSYDVLGKITRSNADFDNKNIREKIEGYINQNRGRRIQEYPPYSSPKVNGKPLFWWAREGRIGEIKIPKKEIEIFEFSLKDFTIVAHDEFINSITRSILEVKGIFRQEEILASWIDFFNKNIVLEFLTAEFTISCSSGTYIRSLAHELGKEIGCGAIAKNIKRVKIGPYTLGNAESV